MALVILFFFELVLTSQTALSLSNNNLEEKVDNLQKQLGLLSDVVVRLVAENNNLKTRVRIVEDIQVRITGEHLDNRTYSKSQVDAQDPEKYDIHSSSDNTRSKDQNENKTSKRNLYESQTRGGFSLERKRIVPPTSTPTGVIAFHSYLSGDSDGPLSKHHILKFDTVPLNRGHGYNAFDGIFLVPVPGTYVFTWSFMSDAHGIVQTQLVKNSEVIGTRYADSATSTVYDFATGTIVVDASQGDHIYIRMADTSHGKVRSISSSRTTFSGWLLA